MKITKAVSIDYDVWNRTKQKHGNFSKVVEKLLREDLEKDDVEQTQEINKSMMFESEKEALKGDDADELYDSADQ